jgi:hypothetical protein
MLPISLHTHCDHQKNGEVTICFHTKHNGHEPGSKSEKYFLHVNPLVIDIDTWKT